MRRRAWATSSPVLTRLRQIRSSWGRRRHEEKSDRRRAEGRRWDQEQERKAEAASAAAADAPSGSILDSIEPFDARWRRAEARAVMPERNRAFLLRVAGLGLALAGIFLLWQALQDRGLVTSPGPATAAPATLAPTTAPTPTTARPASPLSAGPIVATQGGTATSYVVEDVKGDGLRYDWRHSATCASHSGESTATYSWDHPHPPCPDEPFHTSFITVQITDASGQQAVVRQYTLGSRAGRGQVPAGGGVFTPQQPSPTTVAASVTPFPTTTTRPATGTLAPTASPGSTAGGQGPNVPLALFGGALTLGGLGLVLGGPLLWGGPRVRKVEPKDPCEREKAAEAAARERLARARARMDRISALADAQRQTAQDAEAKARAAEESKVGAGYGEANGVRHYTNRQQGARIAAAEAAAVAAREVAARAKAAFDAAGGQGELRAAQDELYKANRDWELANGSLQRCLQLFAPPPPPAPPMTGGTSTGGGVTLGGPVVATGGCTPTQERRCTQGEIKAGSERSTTREITVNELNRAEIVLDAIYPGAQYTPVSEFIEWMDFIRQSFKAGKAINTVINGTVVEGTLDTIDATGIHDVPDFLTYWDKLSEATLKGLKQTSDIFIDRFGKLGGYSLKFTRRIHTATCRTWEQCEGGAWVRKSEVKLEITRTERNRTTRTIDVHDKREIPGAIDRLFTELAGENDRGTRALKAFEEACGR